MKKYLKLCLVIAIVFSLTGLLPTCNVKAAYPFVWVVDGEEIRLEQSNKAGTATWDRTEDALILNNYKGGQINISCRGTCSSEDNFNIKLIGNNEINVKDGFGIVTENPITFIGDGKLTINAIIPIGSPETSEIKEKSIELLNWTSVTIETEKSNIQNPVTDNDQKSDDISIETNTNNSVNVLLLTYCAVVSVVLVLMIIKCLLGKNKK